MEKSCSLCGSRYHNTTFKGGYVCENCINYIKRASEKGEL